MKRAIALLLTFLLVFTITSVMADDKPKKQDTKKQDTEFKPILEEPKIIERPLTPDTGQYMDVPGLPSEPPKKEDKPKKKDKKGK